MNSNEASQDRDFLDRPSKRQRIAIFGAGAVGGYVGSHLARAGHDVTLVDSWGSHVEVIQREGMRISGAAGEYTIPVNALHIHEIHKLARQPVEIVFLCCKLYDTVWAAHLMQSFLAPQGYVVTLQNSLIEDVVAGIYGWGRVVGCIASTISVDLHAPGQIRRTRLPGGPNYAIFRAGEIHGRITPRLERLVDILQSVDSAVATSNLWGERWSKLVANTMTTGVSAITGYSLRQLLQAPELRRLLIRLAAEAIRVGLAQGYALEPIRGLSHNTWLQAAENEPDALKAVDQAIAKECGRIVADGVSGTAQDIRKGRRTENEFMNGLITRQGLQLGLPTPAHAFVRDTVAGLERGDFQPGLSLIAPILESIGPLGNPG